MILLTALRCFPHSRVISRNLFKTLRVEWWNKTSNRKKNENKLNKIIQPWGNDPKPPRLGSDDARRLYIDIITAKIL